MGKTSDPRVPLDERLIAYSVAAGAVMLGAHAARGEIVFTPTNVTLDTAGDVFDVEIDGNTKFTIEFTTTTYYTSTTGGGTITTTANWVDVLAATGGASWRGGSGYGLDGPSALTYGDPVKNGAGAAWGRATANTGNMAYYFNYTGSGSGNFFGQTDKFLGLRFVIGGQTNYAWLEIADVPTNAASVTIAGYAYETVADTEILAGMVPEPNALALLALGAAGIAAMRTH
jgi:hypothetical protein